MLNPAWRPVRERPERLLDISHHFLSAVPVPEAPPPATEPVQLSVLLALAPDPTGAPEAGYLLRALIRQLNLPGTAAGQDWDLQIRTAAEASMRGELVLLLVDPTLDATRTAYTLIKELHARGNEHIGVLFRASDDLAAARRCYRRLAVAAIRFLNQPLVNLGWLPNPGPHFAAALAHAAQIIHSQRRARAPLEVVQ